MVDVACCTTEIDDFDPAFEAHLYQQEDQRLLHQLITRAIQCNFLPSTREYLERSRHQKQFETGLIIPLNKNNLPEHERCMDIKPIGVTDRIYENKYPRSLSVKVAQKCIHSPHYGLGGIGAKQASFILPKSSGVGGGYGSLLLSSSRTAGGVAEIDEAEEEFQQNAALTRKGTSVYYDKLMMQRTSISETVGGGAVQVEAKHQHPHQQHRPESNTTTRRSSSVLDDELELDWGGPHSHSQHGGSRPPSSSQQHEQHQHHHRRGRSKAAQGASPSGESTDTINSTALRKVGILPATIQRRYDHHEASHHRKAQGGGGALVLSSQPLHASPKPQARIAYGLRPPQHKAASLEPKIVDPSHSDVSSLYYQCRKEFALGRKVNSDRSELNQLFEIELALKESLKKRQKMTR